MGKKVIITGSEGLIGKEVCSYMADNDYEVIKCDIQLGQDLSDEYVVSEWFSAHKADCLVNLFALNDHVGEKREKSDIFGISLDSFRKYLEVNLVSLFSCCREFAKNNEGGSIVNFSSTYGVVSPKLKLYKDNPKHIGYAVSKAGVIQLTRYLAVHLAPKFRVNCIVPGGVEFEQDADFKILHSGETPMGRMMKRSEVGGIVEYLCSDKSSYATGAVFTVDGGWTSW